MVFLQHWPLVLLSSFCAGLAYAMLAQIDAIAGIYTAFFPVIVYILLGTSRHVSMGKFSYTLMGDSCFEI
jgi:MFS superfamily sulfate permease-like transporter